MYFSGLGLSAEIALAGAAVAWGLIEECNPAIRAERHAAIRAVAAALESGRISLVDVVGVIGPAEAARVCTVQELFALYRAAKAAGDKVAATAWQNAAAEKLLGRVARR